MACGLAGHEDEDASLVVLAGSTQEEVSSMVAESIREAQISGSDRTVVWDGAAVRALLCC